MTNAAAGLFVILAYVAIVVLSIPLALVTYLLAPCRESFAAVLRLVGAAFGAVVLALLVVAAVAISPDAALGLALATVAEVFVLVGFPLFIGSHLLARWTGRSTDEGLEFATLGLPGALFLSTVFFLFPGGPSRYNITFLEGPAAVAAWSAFVLVFSLGPAVAGLALYRLFERL